ncbi:MAG: AMP-dependent synthetase, partial [Gordonia sp. (in: high G+C Gram-positive bacteria)]
MTTSATDSLRAARDTLLRLRDDYDTAVTEFEWPDVGETFNFGHDWFDTYARGNDSPGLIIVEADGARS